MDERTMRKRWENALAGMRSATDRVRELEGELEEAQRLEEEVREFDEANVELNAENDELRRRVRELERELADVRYICEEGRVRADVLKRERDEARARAAMFERDNTTLEGQRDEARATLAKANECTARQQMELEDARDRIAELERQLKKREAEARMAGAELEREVEKDRWAEGYQEAVDTFAAAFGLTQGVGDVSEVMEAIREGDGWGRFVESIRKHFEQEPEQQIEGGYFEAVWNPDIHVVRAVCAACNAGPDAIGPVHTCGRDAAELEGEPGKSGGWLGSGS